MSEAGLQELVGTSGAFQNHTGLKGQSGKAKTQSPFTQLLATVCGLLVPLGRGGGGPAHLILASSALITLLPLFPEPEKTRWLTFHFSYIVSSSTPVPGLGLSCNGVDESKRQTGLVIWDPAWGNISKTPYVTPYKLSVINDLLHLFL